MGDGKVDVRDSGLDDCSDAGPRGQTVGRPSQTGGQAEGRRAKRVKRAGVGPREH